MKLNVKAFALAGGIFWGAVMFLMTLLAATTGYGVEMMEAIGTIYAWGYNISVGGAFVGLVYGLVDGLIGCGLFALLYNKLAKK